LEATVLLENLKTESIVCLYPLSF